jgi:hypothetical protein
MTGNAENTPQLQSGQTVWERFLGPDAVNTTYHDGFNETLIAVLKRPPALWSWAAPPARGPSAANGSPAHHRHRDGSGGRDRAHALDKVIDAAEDIDLGVGHRARLTTPSSRGRSSCTTPGAPSRVPAPRARRQIAVSTPEHSNLSVHALLHNEGIGGTRHGLDITHIRFFTLRTSRR